MHVAHTMSAMRLASLAAAPQTAASGSIVIHYSPNITVNGASGSPEDWVKAMRRHGDDVVRIVKDKLGRERPATIRTE